MEMEALPENERCCVCCAEMATIRYLRCSSSSYFCSVCFDESHSRTKIFHRAEIWEVCIINIRPHRLYIHVFTTQESVAMVFTHCLRHLGTTRKRRIVGIKSLQSHQLTKLKLNYLHITSLKFE